MHKLARFSVEYPTTIIMIVLAILLLGYISLTRLGINLLPDMRNPKLFIELESGERPPEEIENQFVQQLESVAARQTDVLTVSSVTRVGRAVITVEYSWDADMDAALLDLQKSVSQFVSDDRIDELNVNQYDPNAEPVMMISLYHPDLDDLNELRRTAENVIENKLIRLEGIAAVETIGELYREVRVETDDYRLQAYGISIDELASTLESYNRNVSGGSIVEMGRQYLIKGIGEFTDISEAKNLIVTLKQDTVGSSIEQVPVYLHQVADVSYALTEPENIVRVNGQRCIALEIYKETRFNTIEAVSQLREELESISKSLSEYQITIISDQASFIRSSVNEVEETGIVGAILAILVLYVFLRRIGVTVIISVAIPISVIATFNLMFYNDLTLNIMTLGGLALGAGMLVDNAIVVMENTFRNLEEGKSLKEAAIAGAGQVGGAITSATITTIVVFLPIVYLHGAAGELFKEQAWTVAFSLISSLFVAILVMPMLCTRILSKDFKPGKSKALSFPRYGRFLERVLANKGKVIFGTVILAGLAVVAVPLVGSEFIPRADQGEFDINLTLPEGTDIERTSSVAKSIEQLILENYGDETDIVYSRVGPSSSTDEEETVLQDENNASITVILKSGHSTPTAEVIRNLNTVVTEIPDLQAEFVTQQTALQITLGTSEEPVVVQIKGDELETLEELADTVKARLVAIPDLMNVQTGLERGRPEVNIRVDRTTASIYSLTTTQISTQLSDLLSGREAGEMQVDGEYSDIRITQPDMSLSSLYDLQIETSSGKRVPLSEIAVLEQDNAPRKIDRYNQTRITEITAQLASDKSLDKVTDEVETAISDIELPVDYSISLSGEEEKRLESISSLGFALLLAIILVYMVMASQFESLLHPFVIILTLPLAGVGAVFGLLITGVSFNIMSLIGVIMLAGIAVNDSIILVDYINQLRREGMEVNKAIVRAGQMRIRPILITSVTTILALLPLTIGVGEAASLRSPMAVTVIGGLVTSTILTLAVIPAVYSVLAGRTAYKED